VNKDVIATVGRTTAHIPTASFSDLSFNPGFILLPGKFVPIVRLVSKNKLNIHRGQDIFALGMRTFDHAAAAAAAVVGIVGGCYLFIRLGLNETNQTGLAKAVLTVIQRVAIASFHTVFQANHALKGPPTLGALLLANNGRREIFVRG
jgi:hypothetical protein